MTTPKRAALIPLAQAGDASLPTVGGKASSLGKLMAYGANVPQGFVVPPDYDVSAHGVEIERAFAELGSNLVAVRSSGAAEDGSAQSWAGQFASYLDVERADLLDRIILCRDSGSSERARSYGGGASSTPIAVIVQHMLNPSVSGVLFTANPVTSSTEQIMIECTVGTAEKLVSGLVTPENYVLNKSDGSLYKFVPGDTGVSGKLLNAKALNQLFRAATALEEQFGFPLDLEWAITEGTLFIVQARPITTLDS